MWNSFRDITPQTTRRLKIQQYTEQAQRITFWDRATRFLKGTKTARVSRAVSIKEGLLCVEVASSVVAQEIKLHQRDIIIHYKKKFPSIDIQRIHITVAPQLLHVQRQHLHERQKRVR